MKNIKKIRLSSHAKMQLSFDPGVNALYIRFKETPVTTKHLAEGIAADYDSQGNLAGIEIEGKWGPIRRFDTSHGFIHCDIIHAGGRTEKQPIPAANFNEALTIAEHDLRQFWKNYRDEFLREVESYGKE